MLVVSVAVGSVVLRLQPTRPVALPVGAVPARAAAAVGPLGPLPSSLAEPAVEARAVVPVAAGTAVARVIRLGAPSD